MSTNSDNCKNCGRSRDFNNNCIPYNMTTANNQMNSNQIQVKSKVMWGSVSAIKDLREKEQAEKNSAARTGRRQ